MLVTCFLFWIHLHEVELHFQGFGMALLSLKLVQSLATILYAYASWLAGIGSRAPRFTWLSEFGSKISLIFRRSVGFRSFRSEVRKPALVLSFSLFLFSAMHASSNLYHDLSRTHRHPSCVLSHLLLQVCCFTLKLRTTVIAYVFFSGIKSKQWLCLKWVRVEYL